MTRAISLFVINGTYPAISMNTFERCVPFHRAKAFELKRPCQAHAAQIAKEEELQKAREPRHQSMDLSQGISQLWGGWGSEWLLEWSAHKSKGLHAGY